MRTVVQAFRPAVLAAVVACSACAPKVKYVQPTVEVAPAFSTRQYPPATNLPLYRPLVSLTSQVLPPAFGYDCAFLQVDPVMFAASQKVDDAMKSDDAHHKPAREKANDYFANTLYSRLDRKTDGIIILVMQRLHDEDLVGHLLRQGGWDHLNLPAIAAQDEDIPIGNGEGGFGRILALDETEVGGNSVILFGDGGLTAQLVHVLSSITREGLLYRSDLRLRPEGKSGPVAVGLRGLTAYIDNRASAWELSAYLKMSVKKLKIIKKAVKAYHSPTQMGRRAC
jgi:hypothetical protein